LEDVEISDFMGARLSVASNGSIVYLPDSNQQHTLVWKDLEGIETPLSVPAGQPLISPDGTSLLVRRRSGLEDRLWVHSLERGTFTRFTDVVTFGALWGPNGKKIVYTPMEGDGSGNLHWRNADGTGVEQRLTTSARTQYPSSWSNDGRELLYIECDAIGISGCDLGRLTLTDKPVAELILETAFNEGQPMLSPDGRWLAYESNRSGRSEIYVRPYPDVDSGRWPISVNGGRHPLWSPDGRTLFYSAGTGLNRQMMSVAIETASGFVTGDPRPIFEFRHPSWIELRFHDLHPDGNRFLMVKRSDPEGVRKLVFVANWLDEVKRLVPSDR
jgi:serine/threonine-protein kinase